MPPTDFENRRSDKVRGHLAAWRDCVCCLSGRCLQMFRIVDGHLVSAQIETQLQPFEDWAPDDPATTLIFDGAMLTVLQGSKAFTFAADTGAPLCSKPWKNGSVAYDPFSQRVFQCSGSDTIEITTVKESFRLHLYLSRPKGEESVIAKWGRELCRWSVEGLARPSQIAPFTLDAGSAQVLRRFAAGIGENSDLADAAVMMLAITYKLYKAAEMPSDEEFRAILGLRRLRADGVYPDAVAAREGRSLVSPVFGLRGVAWNVLVGTNYNDLRRWLRRRDAIFINRPLFRPTASRSRCPKHSALSRR
jgi:hypothetical protein